MIRVILLCGLFFTCWACTNSSGKSMATGKDTVLHTNAAAKVLVELFTSQGCSSCPAADKLMGTITASDTNVIALSFHVDYWDRLGWKDVFSNHDYTVRQQQYVSTLHAASLYTPQAIVQGKYEMVGSNRTRLLDAINKVRAAQSPGETITTTITSNGSTVQLHYHLSNPLPKQQIVIVLVQDKASTAIARGENAGAQLPDYNVARNLTVQPAQENGSAQLSLPADLKKENATVILFIQDEQTKAIRTVTQLHL